MDELAALDAPADVLAAIEWLVGQGFQVTQLLTQDQPNGNRLVRLEAHDEMVSIARDRGVWEFGMRGNQWVAALHTLHEAATGEVIDSPPGGPLPQQHPSDDLSWLEAVPAIFAWRAATPDWRIRLDEAIEAGAERIRRQFG